MQPLFGQTKPIDPVFTATTNKAAGEFIQMFLTSENYFWIDWGDGYGKRYEKGSYGEYNPLYPPKGIKGSEIKIYGDDITYIIANNCGFTKAEAFLTNKPLWLELSNNPLQSLNIDECSMLGTLVVNNCNLETLNLGTKKKLETLEISNNNLTSIDLEKCSNLSTINISNNKLSGSFVLPPLVTQFDASSNQILDIECSGCSKLEYLTLRKNKIQKLDLSNMKALVMCDASENEITDIQFNGTYDYITTVSFKKNKLSTADFSLLKDVHAIDISDNIFTSIDISANKSLTSFAADNNMLESVNLENNSKINFLHLCGNKIKELDITSLVNIHDLRADNNKLEQLKIPESKDFICVMLTNNNLSTSTVNTLIEKLPDVTDAYIYNWEKDWKQHLNLAGNTEAPYADLSKATAKGWILDITQQEKPISTNSIEMTLGKKSYYTFKVYAPVGTNVQILDANANVLTEGITDDVFEKADLYLWDFPGTEADETCNIKIQADGNITGLSASSQKIQNINLGECTFITRLELPSNIFNAIDISKLADLTTLNIDKNESLKVIDFSNNNKLEYLNITGCKTLEIKGLGNCSSLKQLIAYNSNIATVLDMSKHPAIEEADLMGCGINDIKLSANKKLRVLYLNDNNITSIDLSSQTGLEDFKMARNKLTTLDLSDAAKLSNIEVEENQLSELILNSEITGSLYCNDNNLSIAELPDMGKLSYYMYAPQNAFTVAKVFNAGDELDLSKMHKRIGCATEEKTSVFTLCMADGTALAENEYYTEDKGIITFLKGIADSVYIKVESDAFPKLIGKKVSKSSMFTVIEKEQFGFTFVSDGTVSEQSFSVTTNPGAKVTIEFPDGVIAEAVGDDEYGITRFGHVIKDVAAPWEIKVKCEKDIKAFTAPYIGVSKLNLNNCGKIQRINVSYSPIENITIPENESFKELYVQGCINLKNIDFTSNTNLKVLNIANTNNIEITGLEKQKSLEMFIAYGSTLHVMPTLSNYTGLVHLDLTNTGIKNIDVSENTMLKVLELSSNKLTSLDISKLENLEEFKCADNAIEELDMTACSKLNVVDIRENKLSRLNINMTSVTAFDCSLNNLPISELPELGIMQSYIYAPQNPFGVNYDDSGILDLSAMYKCRGVNNRENKSSFYVMSENGNSFEEDVDYEEDKGVITFLRPLGKVYVEVENDAFPELTGDNASRSEIFEVAVTVGIESITVSEETVIYDLTGRKVDTPVNKGIYIINGKKVVIK